MTWFKVDDGLHSHRKVMSIPRRERVAAMGLWVLAGSWCADNLTDGHVPRYMLTEWGATRRQAEALVSAGLWIEVAYNSGEPHTDVTQASRTPHVSRAQVEVEGSYQFHEWSQPGRQPTRAEVEANRESERKRKAEQREVKRLSQRDTDRTPSGTPSGTPPGVRTVSDHPDPTRPVLSGGVGSQSSNGRGANGQSDGPDIAKIARLLGSDEQWARRVTTQVLERAPADVSNPTAYVEQAIREKPADYRPTPTPPRKDQLCDHGRERATCPFEVGA
jgi:hypothetical protein